MFDMRQTLSRHLLVARTMMARIILIFIITIIFYQKDCLGFTTRSGKCDCLGYIYMWCTEPCQLSDKVLSPLLLLQSFL